MSFTLADVLPSVAASFGLPVADDLTANILSVTPGRDVVVLLIDGLGAELLARHADVAPTLAGHRVDTLLCGFPATTATSLTSLAVGAPCAQHGIPGYSFAMPDSDGPRLFNALRWRLDSAVGEDARQRFPPEDVQPHPSRLQQLAAADIDVHYVVPAYQRDSGLTAAAFRAPGTLHPASTLDEVRAGVLAVTGPAGTRSRFAYAYFADLDATGHLHGPESPQWIEVLRTIDECVADLLSDLPASCTLLVTGDHGMIHADTVVDLESMPALARDVRLIAGEARARHIYLSDTAALPDALARWSEGLAQHARVVSREQAVDERWFGPTPPGLVVLSRIGDLIAVAGGRSVLVLPGREPFESVMVGHHGAFSADEQRVPLIASR